MESDKDYVRVCRALSHRLKSDTAAKVWVRSKNHFAWLRDFTEQIGRPSRFEEKTARLVLAEQWNVQVPDWLTDTDVLDHDLLGIQVDARKEADFETRALIHFLGAAFQPDMLDSAHLVDVIKALVSDKARAAFKKYPVLHRCLETKCRQWAESSNETWLKNICGFLPGHPNEVWHWLSLWAGLHGYPEKLLEYVLAPKQVLLVQKVPPDALHDLPLESVAKEQMLTQIEFFFADIREKVKSSEDFQRLVQATSGRLLKEYHLISGILRSNQFPPTEKDVQGVQRKFRYCPGVSENQLNALRYYVKPDRPALLGPEEEWSSTQWIRWTVEKYVPYRMWQVHNDYYDEDLEQTVARFTEWYISEYATIHRDPDLSLTHCLRSLSSNPSENDFSIVLLVDCLPLAFMYLLDDALRKEGFSRHHLDYRFSALPTTTKYNKAALLSGEWQEGTGKYEALLKDRAQTEWGNRKVVYLSTLKAMSEIAAPNRPTIVVLNLVDGDDLLHSDVESQNTSYEEELYRLYVRMAEAVSRLSQEWSGPKENISIYVVTDHGACRILKEESQSLDSKVLNRLFANERYRFAVVPENQVNNIPENLWNLGYRFKQPFLEKNTTYFIPRGHNTVRQADRAKGYMHGGATPEEVIVPGALYKFVKAAWKKPAARFLNLDLLAETGRAKFYILRLITLKIEIQNPNSSDIHIIKIDIMEPETDLKNYDTPVISAESTGTLQIGCYFKKAALGKKEIDIEITYEIAGDQHMLPLRLESEFRSAMPSGFSLREL